jgi:glycolate oxidase
MSTSHKVVYKKLEDAVGPEYVSDDPAVLESYSRDCSAPGILFRRRPAYVVLPGNVDEVQKVIKIAQRYKKPFVPIASGYMSTCVPSVPDAIQVHSARMNRILEIDKKNMYAVVEPYVTYSQLSAEAMKRGLWKCAPFSGGQSSVMGNHLFIGITAADYRNSVATRNILGIEWVLPTGDIITTGSMGMPKASSFWGQGPGPSLVGLIKGLWGVGGGLGFVTKMAVKLHPWPGPKTLQSEGANPTIENATKGGWIREIKVPSTKFKQYLINYPTLQEAIDAMYEVGRAEIGAECEHWPAFFACFSVTQSREDFWKTWENGLFQREAPNLVSVCLWAYTSEKQITYEEKVLREIVGETGGKILPEDSEVYQLFTRRFGSDWYREGLGNRLQRPMGGFMPYKFPFDSLDHVAKVREASRKFEEPYLSSSYFRKIEKPRQYGFMETRSGYISTVDFCHWAHCEIDVVFDQEMTKDDPKSVGLFMQMFQESIGHDMEMGSYPYASHVPGVQDLIGPHMHNYHEWLRKVKRVLDPNNVANPPYPVTVE